MIDYKYYRVFTQGKGISSTCFETTREDARETAKRQRGIFGPDSKSTITPVRVVRKTFQEGAAVGMGLLLWALALQAREQERGAKVYRLDYDTPGIEPI